MEKFVTFGNGDDDNCTLMFIAAAVFKVILWLKQSTWSQRDGSALKSTAALPGDSALIPNTPHHVSQSCGTQVSGI